MDPHHTARLLAIGRMAVGALLMVVPGVVTRPLTGGRPSRTVRLLARTTGARDLVLGAGAFAALADGSDASPWVKAGAAADAVDAVALAAASREIGAVAAVGGGAVAAAAAVVGFRAAHQLER
jgi:hypothetical protein